jgi:hypothetical protein
MGGSIMSKTKISEYSSTAASNTDVQGINIAEGMLPSDVNNAMRAIMAHLKNFQAGLSGDSVTVGGNLSVTGTGTIGGNTDITGTLSVTGDTSIGSTGAIKVPVGTTAQRPTASTGKIRYNSTLGAYEGYDGASWSSLGGGATGGGGDQVFNLNTVEVTTSYSLPAGKNAVSVGSITINSGVTVTVPSGQRWVVL